MDKPAEQSAPPEKEMETIEAEIVEDIEEIPLERAPEYRGKPAKISIMGQEAASVMLQGAVNVLCETGNFSKPILITAPPGTGKTHTYRTFRAALEKTDIPISFLEVDTATKFSRLDESSSLQLIEALERSAAGYLTVIKIDEAHLLERCGAAMRRIFDELIFGAGETWGRAGTVTHNGKAIDFDSRFLCFVLITNYPDKIMRGNAVARARRFLNIELQLYSPSIMRKLTTSYFKEKNIEVAPEILPHLVKLHRGTLEALDDFNNRAAGHHNGKLTKEVFDLILPLCDYTFRGFRRDEIRAMKWLLNTKEPRTERNLLRNYPYLNADAMYRHAKWQETKAKDGSMPQTPYITIEKTEYKITKEGETFLSKYNKQFATV